jgi:hypothetical protein
MEISQIEPMMPYVDLFQVGARNMQNFNLLRELGAVRKPVLLKRGIAATIEELLLSAEYILAGGNYDVILCERGIRTFETYTRNTMDISAIPVVKKLSHLPIVGDPSHGTGRRDKVPPWRAPPWPPAPTASSSKSTPTPTKPLSDGAQPPIPCRPRSDSQVVLLAVPIYATLDFMEKLSGVLGSDHLVTDVGSTKAQISAAAARLFNRPDRAAFLPGHPMAGKERGGAALADAALFRGAVWLFTDDPNASALHIRRNWSRLARSGS